MSELLKVAKALRDSTRAFANSAEELNYSLKKLSLAQKLLIFRQTGVYPND